MGPAARSRARVWVQASAVVRPVVVSAARRRLTRRRRSGQPPVTERRAATWPSVRFRPAVRTARAWSSVMRSTRTREAVSGRTVGMRVVTRRTQFRPPTRKGASWASLHTSSRTSRSRPPTPSRARPSCAPASAGSSWNSASSPVTRRTTSAALAAILGPPRRSPPSVTKTTVEKRRRTRSSAQTALARVVFPKPPAPWRPVVRPTVPALPARTASTARSVSSRSTSQLGGGGTTLGGAAGRAEAASRRRSKASSAPVSTSMTARDAHGWRRSTSSTPGQRAASVAAFPASEAASGIAAASTTPTAAPTASRARIARSPHHVARPVCRGERNRTRTGRDLPPGTLAP